MIKFLHTADWQLGMGRHFLNEGVQERFTQARFDAIRKMGQIARDEGCRFMIVSGDVFDSNLLDRTTVSRAIEAMKNIDIPIYLLPGNHDPLNIVSIYKNKTFLDRKPSNVHVLVCNRPVSAGDGVEIVGVPWSSKRPLNDLVAEAIDGLEPSSDVVRIVVAHGIVDTLSPDSNDPAVISLEKMERALDSNLIHYVALGDRHSLTQVGKSKRIWYSGAPEPTDYREDLPGMAIVASIEDAQVTVKDVVVGQWKFIERSEINLNVETDVDSLSEWLDGLEDKERTIVKLRFVGTVSLSVRARLEELLDRFGETGATLQARYRDLIVIPDDADFADLGFSGFVNSTVEQLRSVSESGSVNSTTARDALAMLVRFVEAAK